MQALTEYAAVSMPVPEPRGELSAALVEALHAHRRPTDLRGPAAGLADRYRDDPREILLDDDAQLVLTMLYELHLAGLSDVDPEWEWNTEILDVRRRLEGPFDAALRSQTEAAVATARSTFGSDVVSALWQMTAPTAGPGLAEFMAKEADVERFREFLVHRSLNQLREADLHTWGIPRLQGPPKAALVEIQADEYGGGRFDRMHSRLFARTMRALDLSSRYAHYVDAVPALTLAALNALSYFGIHRRLLGALIGHLCAVETTSALPSRKFAEGLRRLGFGTEATLFFDEHVEADSVHEQIAVRDLAGGYVAGHPEQRDDVLFGAATCLTFDELVGAQMSQAWAHGASSLRA